MAKLVEIDQQVHKDFDLNGMEDDQDCEKIHLSTEVKIVLDRHTQA